MTLSALGRNSKTTHKQNGNDNNIDCTDYQINHRILPSKPCQPEDPPLKTKKTSKITLP